MAAILNKGGFLPETEYEWLDKFKATIASDSIQVLLQQLEKSASLPDDIVSICNAVLLSDPLCEEAIYYKCKALINMKQHASAKKIYTDFTKAYQNLYGESFDKPYSEMIDQAIAVP
jgi:two-component SAPR family response regulator